MLCLNRREVGREREMARAGINTLVLARTRAPCVKSQSSADGGENLTKKKDEKFFWGPGQDPCDLISIFLF